MILSTLISSFLLPLRNLSGRNSPGFPQISSLWCMAWILMTAKVSYNIFIPWWCHRVDARRDKEAQFIPLFNSPSAQLLHRCWFVCLSEGLCSRRELVPHSEEFPKLKLVCMACWKYKVAPVAMLKNPNFSRSELSYCIVYGIIP